MKTPHEARPVGSKFTSGNPSWGIAVYTVVQILPDGTRVCYRENQGKRDERNRWYLVGGGVRGVRKMEDV